MIYAFLHICHNLTKIVFKNLTKLGRWLMPITVAYGWLRQEESHEFEGKVSSRSIWAREGNPVSKSKTTATATNYYNEA